MSRTAEGLWGRGGVGECLDCLCPVVSRYSCGAAFELVDGNSEWGSQYRGVVLYLMWQVKLLTSLNGDGGAQYTTRIFQHEVHLLGGDLLCCYYQVSLVFSVFVINNDNELSFSEVFYGFFNSI